MRSVSHPILGVFGHSLFLADGERFETTSVAEVADINDAALQLAHGLRGPVNVLYQPADLQVIAAECANAARAKLHAYFSGEYPELANPAILWACTRPIPHRDGKYATILHHEIKPRLEALIGLLAERGILVRTALPPAAALVEARRGPPLELAILQAGDCFLFFHLNELGIPAVRFVRSIATLGEHLAEALGSRQHPPATIRVVGDSPSVGELLETHALRAAHVSWPDFLRGIDFDGAGPANFAQRPFRWGRQHTQQLAAALLALAAAGLAGDSAYRHLRARQLSHNVRAVREQLERDVARLETAERRYREGEAVLAAAPLGTPRPSLVLDAVTQTLPAPLQLQAFRYSNGAFTLDGVAYEPGLAPWLENFGSGPRPWKLKPTKPSGAQWTVSGQFSP